MSITTDAKDELTRVHVDNTNARKAEVTALLRYTDSLRIVDNHLVFAAELDLASTARRLQANIEELYNCHASLRVVAAGATRPATGYLIYVGKDAEPLARRTGLLDRRGAPVRGMPPHISGTIADAESVWRGAFQARGALVDNGRTTALEVHCPGPEAALALVGAARKLGVHAKMRVIQERDRVTIRDDDISELLSRMGAHHTRPIWDAHVTRRRARAASTPGEQLANFNGANRRRSSRAAAEAVARAQRALEILGPAAPALLADAGQLRIAHPDVSLDKLAQLAEPPISKDTVAGRIRRLIRLADSTAHRAGIPDTEAALAWDQLKRSS
ncbi:DNA-binding protein WhiA [Mycobacteroides abscessus]|uniref:DNA-binding protein WhiA n=1 Tax=Mycobacteroides abscessus TaxID=36809 RepID=UPI0034E8A82E